MTCTMSNIKISAFPSKHLETEHDKKRKLQAFYREQQQCQKNNSMRYYVPFAEEII